MKRLLSIPVLAACLALALAPSLPAQRVVKGGPAKALPGKAKAAARRRTEVDKFNRMTPEERKKALENLPEPRREKVERQIQEYNRMPPEERRRLRQQLETFRSLPPEKQEAARRVFRGMNAIPEDRRAPVREEMRSIRSLSESDRQRRLNSDEFRNKYTPEEQRLIREGAKILPPE